MVSGGVLIVTSPTSTNYDSKNQKFTFEVFKVAMLSAIGGFLFGYDTGIVSGAMVYIKDTIQDKGHPLSDLWQEAIISVTILGAWIFSAMAGSLSDKIGRRKVVLLASAIFAIGSIIMGAAPDKWSLLVGRFIAGAGVGFASMVVPTYIAEVAPSRYRGSLVTTNNLFITGGQAIAGITAGIFSISGLETYHVTLGWRLMLALAAVPAIIQFVGFIFMPESPRWLVRNGYQDQARIVLQKLRGSEADISQEFNDMLISCIDHEEITVTTSNNNNNLSKKGSPSYLHVDNENEDNETTSQNDEENVLWQVLKDKHLRKALLVGSMLQAIAQLIGINTVMYYSATIILMSGIYDKSIAVWMAAATAVLHFLTNFLGIYLVEKIGRRPLTLISLAGTIISLSLLAVGFAWNESNSPDIYLNTTMSGETYMTNYDVIENCNRYTKCSQCINDDKCGFCFNDNFDQPIGSCLASNTYLENTVSLYDSCQNGTMIDIKQVWAPDWCPSSNSWIVLFGLSLYLLFFGPGMGPMPWTINSEIFPLWARGVCYSMTTSVNWFFNFLVSVSFLTLTKYATKQGAFAIYAMFGILGWIFFYFNLPETKGKSLEDASRLFGNTSQRPSVANSRRQSRANSYGATSMRHNIRKPSECFLHSLNVETKTDKCEKVSSL